MSSIFSTHDLSISEFSVVLLVRNQNPTLLNLDFLKYSGVVPHDWEVASAPILSQQGSLIIFQNGLRLAADTTRTIFLENTTGKSIDDAVSAEVAKRYTQILSQAEYESLGINLTGFVTFRNHPQLAESYLSKALLLSGNWLEFGTESPKVDLNISYTLEQGKLNLQINQTPFPQENEEASIPAVKYFGNFDYSLQQVEPTNKLTTLQVYLEQWQSNVETFKTLINQRFHEGINVSLLGSTQSLTGQTVE
jgi:hypothetical protein